MRVLILGTDVYSKGGIERYSRYQYDALKTILGEDNAYIFSLRPEPPEKDKKFEESISPDYTGRGLGLFSKLIFVFQVLTFVRKNRIDILICTHVQLSVIGLIAKSLLGTRYFTNVYGLEIWSGLQGKDVKGLLSSDGLIGDCKFVLDYIAKNFEYNGNSHLLYDPVDIKKFHPEKRNQELEANYSIPKGPLRLMTVGRLERNKGHEIVIRSLPLMGDDVIYVVVGDGKYKDKYLKLAESLGVSSKVMFVGRVPEDELAAFYCAADIVVLLSVFSEGEGEGLPLGLIEASASGKPIICGNRDGSAEAYNDADPNGFVIDPENVNSFVESVNKYKEEPRLIQVHGNAGRSFIVDNLGMKQFICGFENILKGKSIYLTR